MSAAPSIESHLNALQDVSGERERLVAPLVREYLDEVRTHLAELHGTSQSGRRVNEANSDLVDRLVRRLFVLAEESLLSDGGGLERGLCVVAAGGYARREMSIHSDVDLLVLYRDELTPYVASIAERLQYWLWDAGLTVGCATRTIADTVKMGREDVTVRTAVLTARFLCGDGEFFHDFADAIRRELLPDVESFIREQVENRLERHRSFGESLFLLQPNVKEGAGGLRDYHSAYWVARGAQPSIRDLDDLLHFGLLTEAEMKIYRAALDFLWLVRNQLHLASGRCNDQLSFEMQELVAESMGYGSSEDTHPDLPVERFMRDYYRYARAIENYSELVIEQCVSRVSSKGREQQRAEVEHGFVVTNGQLHVPHSAHLRQKPKRLLEVFEVAQRHDVPLSRLARRLVRENLDCIDDDVRHSADCREVFLRILASEQRVMRTLMAMNEVGLMAAYLPEWEHIVCRWQHVLYHTYTVDVHTIFLVEELRRLWQGKYRAAMPELTDLVRDVGDQPALYLGCLLHDIGKGFGGNHSAKGVVRARVCLERLGLDAQRVDRILFLVEHHLTMSRLAESRDLGDPKVLLEFAQICGDAENLRNLYLITFADTRACSPEAWTDWRGQLLRELFERTSEFLELGADSSDKAIEVVEAGVSSTLDAARSQIARLGVGAEKIEAFFEGMPRRYFIAHTPEEIARHAEVVLRFGDGRSFSSAVSERGGFAEFIVCARDVHGLYAKVAGSLASGGMNILTSHVYTTRSGLALEIYRVKLPPGGREERSLEWREFDQRLDDVLADRIDVEELVVRRRRARLATPLPPVARPSTVIVTNDESNFYSLVEVTADDRIGLLFDLAATIGHHGFEVYLSKIGTVRDQVTDTFYLKGEDGEKVRDGARLEALREALLEVVRSVDDPRNG